MKRNKAIPIFLMIIFFTFGKVECKFEKIKKHLTTYEFVNFTEISIRTPAFILLEDSEKSVQFKAFGKTFILDLRIYFPGEDSELEYIYKGRNVTDSFLGQELLIHQGYVRDVKDSFVIGYFSKDKHFRAYVVIPDEVYCVEPTDVKNSYIVYRFKDVIFPGCTKSNDCSETSYFEPWPANKPPPKIVPSLRYSLFYDKYFELFNRLYAMTTSNKTQKKDSEGKNEQEGSNDTKDKKKEDKGHNGKDEKEAEEDHKEKNRNEEQKDHKEKERKKEHEEKDEKKEEKHDKEKDIGKEDKDQERGDKRGKENLIESDNEGNESVNLYLKQENDSKNDIPEWISSEQEEHNNNESKTYDKIHDGHVDKTHRERRNDGRNLHSPAMQTLEESVMEEKCYVQLVVAPSLLKKFSGQDQNILKDIYTQFTLLNKIFRKVILMKSGVPIHLNLYIQSIIFYGDEVYSPFNLEADLEYFTKSHRQNRQYCLTIGLVNQLVKSDQYFDGYIPESGGGACALSGNTMIVSHGNDDTPAPMAMYFAGLVRVITRSLGANDRDSQCSQGSYPHPLQVLKDYLLAKKIYPSKNYSIFTACNVQEIDRAMRGRECFLTMYDPLCGNGILDEGEECDCGPAYHCERVDPCCNVPHLNTLSKASIGSHPKCCTLVKGAKCSTMQECCSGCVIETNTKMECVSGNGICDIAFCNGKSADCPKGVEASNGMVCSEYNETLTEPLICKDKKCNFSLCTGHGLKPCTCAQGTGRDCVYCCIKDGKCRAAGSQLKLMGGRDFFKPDGMQCIGGECLGGKCYIATGMQQMVVNNTAGKSDKPPIFPSKANGFSSLSTLNFIMGIWLGSVLVLVL